MISEPTQQHGGGGGSRTPPGLRQVRTRETWEELGEVTGKGRRVAAPNASPHLYRHGGDWWLALQGPRVVGQRGRKEIPPFLPHRSYLLGISLLGVNRPNWAGLTSSVVKYVKAHEGR